jgi:hypothetical protein
MKFIAKYGRKEATIQPDENGNLEECTGAPTGVVLALRDEEGKVCFGWSACDSQDTFSKKEALRIAKRRALTHSKKPIPSSLSEVATSEFVERCEKYFNEKNLSFRSFIMEGNVKTLNKVDSTSPMQLYYNPDSTH